MMLTPQYSLRRLLLLVTISGVLCLVPVVAARGYLWAIALAAALAGGIIYAMIAGLLYTMTGGIGRLLEQRQASSQNAEGT